MDGRGAGGQCTCGGAVFHGEGCSRRDMGGRAHGIRQQNFTLGLTHNAVEGYSVSARRGSVLVTTAIRVLASLLAAGGTEVAAQTQPATLPTAVAQAMSFEPSVFGRPQFFDAQTPTDWPAALVPPGAKVLGGGIVGDGTMLRMSVAVFEFSGQSNPRAVLEAVVAKAGFGSPAPPPPASPTGGFAETAAPTSAGKYCKGSTLVAFVPVDSVRAPRVFAVSLVDGEAGRQNF